MTTILDRITIAGIASAGLCAVAVALTPPAVAVPFATGGGSACMEGAMGAGGACAGAVTQAAAPIVPAAAPGPIVPVVPAAPVIPAAPVPVVPVVPAAPVAPIAAAPVIPAAAAAPVAPVLEMGGVAGKGDPVGAPPATEGVPFVPGPQS